MLWTSPIYKQVKTVVKAGFTGKKRDARGYNICYQNGKRVPCNALGEGKKKPASKKPAKKPVEQSVKEIRDLVESGQGTPEKLLGLIASHTVAELKQIQKDLGLSVKGNPLKKERANKIAESALALMEKPIEEAQVDDSLIPTPDDLATPTGELTFDELKERLPNLSDQELVKGISVLETMGKAVATVADGAMTNIEFTGQVTQEDLDEAFEPSYAKKISFNKKLQEKIKSIASIPDTKEESLKESNRLLGEIQAVLAKADKLKGKKREALLGEYENLREQRYREIYNGAKERSAKVRAKLIEAIKVENPSQVSFSWGSGNESPSFKKSTLESRAFLTQVLAKTGGADMAGQIVMEEKDGRAHYNTQWNRVTCSSGSDPATFVHEFSHAIEENMPGVHRACLDFLQERTKGEEPISLSEKFGGYSENEVGRKDDFAKAFGDDPEAERYGYYVGKDYGGGATEILSMGVELLYRDPSGFAKRDPEYCGFVLGILDGSLRSKKKPSDDSATPIDIDRED